MKKVIIVLALIIVVLALTEPSFGRGWTYRGHHHWHGWGYYNGWETAAIVGGSILLGTFLGMAINNNYRYAPVPQVEYMYPKPQPYAAPDPAFIERYTKQTEKENYPGPAYSSGENRENTRGGWVTVPGQWVNNSWVPAHQVWVPENP